MSCLLRVRYRRDRRARRFAIALYREFGSVAGLETAQIMNGGWRGRLKLVPHLPIGRRRRHLGGVLAAFRDLKRVLGRLRRGASGALRFRYHPLALRFFRSVGRHTPSAYAWQWTVSYNVNGSLLGSRRGIRQTLFHEIFHLNDAAHGGWSRRALGPLYARILNRCRVSGTRLRWPRRLNRCLRPYAPSRTKVRRVGLYYAFHPQSGVAEYAAELALRFYLEQRRRIRRRRVRQAFKCGPKEHAIAWRRLSKEFFGGADLVPPCRP